MNNNYTFCANNMKLLLVEIIRFQPEKYFQITPGYLCLQIKQCKKNFAL